MKFPLYIAKRYLFSKSENNAINIISKIASLGVIVGSLLLLVVLSGFEGLKTYSLSYTSIVDPDYRVFPSNGKQLSLNTQQQQQLSNNNVIESYSRVIEENAYAQFRDKNELVIFKAVDKNYNQTVRIDSTLVSGKWMHPKSYQSVCGWALSDKLHIGVFDYSSSLKLYVPKPGKGQINQHTFKNISVQNVGLLDINEELNDKSLFISLEAGQELMGYSPNISSYLELKTIEGVNKEKLYSVLKNILGNDIIIKNRIELNDGLHKMLNTENVVVYAIFTLILIVALFNVVGAIIMMIIDKKKDMKTLYNLGTSLTDIKKIFFLQGSLLTLLGGTLGIVIAIVLIGAQIIFEPIKVPGTDFAYPVELNIQNILIALVTIFILGLSASKIASYRISKKLLA